MLKINNLTKIYAGSQKGVESLTLHVQAGDLYAFIGHNGAGKTTALKSVCGIHDFDSGEIFIDGINIKKDELEAKNDYKIKDMESRSILKALHKRIKAIFFLRRLCDKHNNRSHFGHNIDGSHVLWRD